MSQHQMSPHREVPHRSTVPPVLAPRTVAALSSRRVTRSTRRAAARRPAVPTRTVLRPADADLGATTVEYAVVVLAAAAFGGVMAAVLASGQVRKLLMAIIEKALGI